MIASLFSSIQIMRCQFDKIYAKFTLKTSLFVFVHTSFYFDILFMFDRMIQSKMIDKILTNIKNLRTLIYLTSWTMFLTASDFDLNMLLILVFFSIRSYLKDLKALGGCAVILTCVNCVLWSRTFQLSLNEDWMRLILVDLKSFRFVHNILPTILRVHFDRLQSFKYEARVCCSLLSEGMEVAWMASLFLI